MLGGVGGGVVLAQTVSQKESTHNTQYSMNL